MYCDSVSESCDVCQCSRMIKSNFKLSHNRDVHNDESCLDKENISPLKNETDISLYGNSSPARITCGNTSPSHCSHHFTNIRRPLEYHDPNSQDSGYSASYAGESGRYFGNVSPRPSSSRLSFGSSSVCSVDDEFLDFSDMEPLDDNNLPRDFNKLISGSIIALQEKKRFQPTDSLARPVFRRSLSLQYDNHTPNSTRIRSTLFTSEDTELRPFKRPEPPSSTLSPVQNKRSRIFGRDDATTGPNPRPKLKHTMSATEESIECALQRSSNEPDLIGDFSKTFCLPLISGRHKDLKSITPATLAKLMKGDFESCVASFKVIDCRYPYEYEGGHISGAVNIFTKDQCAKLLEERGVENEHNEKRNILVFHCEFSSERGPSLSRYLRNLDRRENNDVYPALTYPEIYLLDGGYKNFYEKFSELCVPMAYKQMNDPEHESDLRRFRSKSKTLNNDIRPRPQLKSTSLKRLGFL